MPPQAGPHRPTLGVGRLEVARCRPGWVVQIRAVSVGLREGHLRGSGGEKGRRGIKGTRTHPLKGLPHRVLLQTSACHCAPHPHLLHRPCPHPPLTCKPHLVEARGEKGVKALAGAEEGAEAGVVGAGARVTGAGRGLGAMGLGVRD